MEISLILLKKLGVMFSYMLLGYVLYKTGLLNEKRNKYLSNFLLYIIFSVVIVNSFAIHRTEDNLSGFVDSFLLAVVSIAISMLISHLIYEKYTYRKFKKKMPIDDIGVAFSSAGFMGLPIVASMFGRGAVFFASSFAAILTFLQWTYGVMVIADSKEYVRIKKILLNPVLISMVIGIIIYLFEITVPSPVKAVFKGISFFNAPVVMIILGVYLAQTEIMSMFTDRSVYVSSFLRLIFVPLATMAVIKFLPGSTEVKLIIMIAASAPVGSNVAIFAQLYGGDYTKAVKIVCMSTVLCVITMPLIMGLANTLFM